ncbi:MAG: hypothetical protein EPO21_08060 [Chloroflexota bacterium]|nr:MAG: hypothetical protein EPO21_08060 [Chloroflexota bacterium]
MLTRPNQIEASGGLYLGAGRRQAPRSRRPATKTRDPYMAFALRWWWLFLFSVALGVFGAWSYTRTGAVPYQSTAVVAVASQVDPFAPNAATQRLAGADAMAAANYAAQGSSYRVYQLASQALSQRKDLDPKDLQQVDLGSSLLAWGRNTLEPLFEAVGLPALPEVTVTSKGPRDLSPEGLISADGQRNIDIKPSTSGNVIRVSVTDLNPGFAKLLADSIANAFVQNTNEDAGATVDDRLQQIQQQMDGARQHLVAAQLSRREQDLLKQLQEQRAQYAQIDMSYQQGLLEMDRADQLAAASTSSEDAAALAASQAKWQELSAASAPESADWLSKLMKQQTEVEKSIDEFSAQLASVQQSLAAIPASKDPLVDAASSAMYAVQAQQLTSQSLTLQTQLAASPDDAQLAARADQTKRDLETARQRAAASELRGREQDLLRNISGARAQLLQIHANYQQQLNAQLDIVRTSAQMTSEAARAQQQRTLQDLTEQSTKSRSQWSKVISQHRTEAQQVISELNDQLAQVRTAMKALPAGIDPGNEEALASGYVGQIQQLTQEFTRLQLNADLYRNPLSLVGHASDAQLVLGRMTIPLAGVGSGAVLGVILLGPVYLLRLLLGGIVRALFALVGRFTPARLRASTTVGVVAVTPALDSDGRNYGGGGLSSPTVRRAPIANRKIRSRQAISSAEPGSAARALRSDASHDEELDVERTIEALSSQVTKLRQTVIALRSASGQASADDPAAKPQDQTSR